MSLNQLSKGVELACGGFVINGAYGKPSEEKNCFCLYFLQTALIPAPVFLERFEEVFQNLVLYDVKFLKVLDFGHPPQFSLENV